MDREITPPPAKRLRKNPGNATQLAPGSVLPEPSSCNDASIVRIYSWNINGITPFLQTSLNSYFTSPMKSESKASKEKPVASLRQFLRRHNWPQIVCLQEIKIGPADLSTLAAVKRAVNSSSLYPSREDGPRYEVFTTLPTDKFNARGLGSKGRVYGVANIIRSDFYSRYVKHVRTVDWDAEGRVSIIEIEDPESGRKLSVWNVYAVNGTNNEYRSSKTGEVMGTRHDRKLTVHRLMMEECLALESDGWDIIIIGDLNIAPQRIDGHPNLRIFPQQHVINRADFNSRFLDLDNGSGLRAIDVWRHLRGSEKKYTYHGESVWGTSCDRVDLALASRRLVEDGRVLGCEIWDSELERGPSDHVPLSVDIKLTAAVEDEEAGG